MANTLDPGTPKEKISKFPIFVLILMGLGLIGYCIVGGIALLNRDQPASTVDKNVPSATQQVQEGEPPPLPSEAAQSLISESASQWAITLEETFDSNQNDWIIGEGSTEELDSNLEIRNGRYTWDVTSKNTILASLAPASLPPVTDFYLSADVKLTGGSYKPVYGVVFRDSPNGDGYFFGIYGENFIVDRRYGDTFERRIAYIKSPAISPQETNRLAVIAKGTHFVFLINDQFVGEMFDDSIHEGSVGFGVTFFHVDLQNSFEFDNFVLRTP